ncbi:homoserine O-acetyltransferase [Collybia nuda]|uniref:Homoserine O-acetyltransferase n=1 Tax=Collybia nuda TaxID=64659 RepID=A0A9P6CLM3_9AGAR|nr:homoserine O-acetyltransferase [Collybia nuda]
MTAPPAQTQYYHHGRFRVAGGVLPDAITAYRTYGDPGNPCIIFPTSYSAKLDGQARRVGENKALNPKKYFIVTFATFCNGEPSPYNGPYFPAISYEDNILGVKKIFMAFGFSMGGQQAYHWAVVFPDFVERYVVICGSAKTSIHNKAFLEGPKAALLASKDFEDGHYKTNPERGIRAFARVWSAWAYGQSFFRGKEFEEGGAYPNLESFFKEKWEQNFLGAWDANDMLALLETWYTGDISIVRHGGNLGACLADIKARGLILPCQTDLYFPPEDSIMEGGHLKERGRIAVIPSTWGHMAGTGANPEADAFIQGEVMRFMEEPL